MWGLHRRAYSLECAVADLEEKLLVEVKRRAGTESARSKKADKELFDVLTAQPEPKKDEPWWTKYVTHPELRQS